MIVSVYNLQRLDALLAPKKDSTLAPEPILDGYSMGIVLFQSISGYHTIAQTETSI